MNLILLGPQGSGKGTQAELIVAKYGLNYVEMGGILRSIANSDNKYAKIVRDAVDGGNLVPDEYVRLIAWDHINGSDREKGFLFDGYPRSVAQYEHLEDMLKKFNKKIDRVIFLEVSEAESIRRLSSRRVCERCSEIFNLVTQPPKNAQKCDKCGGRLGLREDDKPEAIKRRLQLYRERTTPILEKALGAKIALEIDGERSVEKIFGEIEGWLK